MEKIRQSGLSSVSEFNPRNNTIQILNGGSKEAIVSNLLLHYCPAPEWKEGVEKLIAERDQEMEELRNAAKKSTEDLEASECRQQKLKEDLKTERYKYESMVKQKKAEAVEMKHRASQLMAKTNADSKLVKELLGSVIK